MRVILEKSQLERVQKIVSEFLKDFSSAGVCKAWVDEELHEGNVMVWVSLNLNYLERSPERGGSARLAQTLRNIVQKKIQDSLGIYVIINSIGERC